MGLGILEDTHLAHVPGTSLFRDDPNAAALAHLAAGAGADTEDPDTVIAKIDLSKLKHASGKHSHIVLVPQPSDDPNGPLNGPVWKKHLVSLRFLCLLAMWVLHGVGVGGTRGLRSVEDAGTSL